MEGMDGAAAEGDVVGPPGPVVEDDQLAVAQSPRDRLRVQGRRARINPCQ